MRTYSLLPILAYAPQLALAQAGGPCLIYGADAPAPQQPSTDPAVKAALANIRTAIAAGARNNDSTPYGPIDIHNTAFSVEIFSIQEPGSLLTYHNTPPLLRNSSQGTKQVDDNSIYRLGSISKLLTVYTYLLAAGDRSWNTPVTELILELADAEKATTGNAINAVDWDSITPGALASQLAGLGRLHTQSAALDAKIGDPATWPPADQFDQTQCGIAGYLSIPCNRTKFFDNFLARPPVVPAFQTPIYSNDAFFILGYALESLTNISLSSLFTTHLTTLHSLNSTYSSPPTGPDISLGVIPGGNSVAHFLDDPATLAPAGGHYSSIADMQKLGCAILNSTYLKPAMTRRWFKPRAFNADPRGAVGAPWEMLRAPPLPTSHSSRQASTSAPNCGGDAGTNFGSDKLTWIYTKSGDVGTYSNLAIYMPEYGIGATILTAWTTEEGLAARFNLGDIVISELYPALEAATRRQVQAKWTGMYSNEGMNATIQVAGDEWGGLNLQSWTQNGSDVRGRFVLDSRLDPTREVFTRLVPTGLEDVKDGKTKAVNFRLIASEAVRNVETRPASSLCSEWVLVDQINYGRFGLDSLVFEVGDDGRATGVRVPAFGVSLQRVE